MKLAELLLQRAQLQNDLQDQANRVQDNAQVLEGEEPNEKPDEILLGAKKGCNTCLDRWHANHEAFP